MSRLIKLRSPYFIKVEAEEGKTLTAATADIFIWKGKLTDKPSTRNYRLSKQVNIPSEDSDYVRHIIFEVSEMARDIVDVKYTNKERETEPVYINAEISKANSDGTLDYESVLVTGLDGWGYHGEGIQATQNLFVDADDWTAIDRPDQVDAKLSSDLGSRASILAGTGYNITFTCTSKPATATIAWQKDGETIMGQTNSTYSITNLSASDDGEYTCSATQDDESVTSNSIDLTVSTPKVIIIPDVVNTVNEGGTETLNQEVIHVIYSPDATTITDDDFELPDFVEVSVGDTTMTDGRQDTEVTIWTPQQNINTEPLEGMIMVNVDNEEEEVDVIQAGIDAITSVFVLNPNIGTSGVDADNQIKVTVLGTKGAEYELDFVDVSPSDWTDAGQAMNRLKGVVGETTHYINNIDENKTTDSRKFTIRATNEASSDDVAFSQVVTQYPREATIQIVESSLDEFDADGEDMTIQVWNTAPGTLRLRPVGSNHFKFVTTPEEYPLDELLVTSLDINDLYEEDDPLEVTIRAPRNNGGKVRQSVSALLLGSNEEKDTLPVIQTERTAHMFFQENDVPVNDTTELTSLPTGGDGTDNSIGYFQVNASGPWTIEHPNEAVLSQTSGKGFTRDISVYINQVNDSGSVENWTLTLKDKSGSSLPDKNLSVAQASYSGGLTGVPTNPRFTSTSDDAGSIGDTIDLSVTADGTVTTYHVSLQNWETLGVDPWSDSNSSGDFEYTFTKEGTYRFFTYAENTVGPTADYGYFNSICSQEMGSDDPFTGVTQNPPVFDCTGEDSFFDAGIMPLAFTATLTSGFGQFCLDGTCEKRSVDITSGNYSIYTRPHYDVSAQAASGIVTLTATGYTPKLVYLKQAVCAPNNPLDELGEPVVENNNSFPTPGQNNNVNNNPGGGGGSNVVPPDSNPVVKNKKDIEER